MKRNKLAAGALALALGFGAVAPSFADEAKAETSTRLFQEQYKTVLDRTNKERADFLAAKAAYDTAEKNLTDARALVEQKAKEYEELRKPAVSNLAVLVEEEQNAWDYLDSIVSGGVAKRLVNRTTETYTIYSLSFVNGGVGVQLVPHTYTTSTVVGLTEETLVNYVNQYASYNTDGAGRQYNEQELRTAYRRWENANADLKRWSADVNKLTAKLQELRAAETARDVAQTQYDDAKAALAKHYVGGVALEGKTIWETSLADVQAAAHGYNVTVEAVDGKIVIVEEKAETDAEKRAKLQEAIDRAKTQIQAVKFLKEKTPETIKGIVKELDALVKEQEARIATAEAALAKTTASVFTTVYADEDVDFDKLADELNESSDKIDSLLEENEKEQAEKADEEKVEDADDDKEEETEEKTDDKKEEKTDDKKEDDKKVIEKTTTVVTPATTNKTAGSNAKTGIAGVAGVAGILAAASAAYAASKKN